MLFYLAPMENHCKPIKIAPEKLKAARGSRPPSEVARKLGISYQFLNMIENGRRNVSAVVLVNMCKLYDVQNIFQLTTEE